MISPRLAGDVRAATDAFDALMTEVMEQADRFGHRQHVHLTWLAVRRHGTGAAITMVSDGIRRTARYAGAPQKYHATVSRAWVELVGFYLAISDDDNFDTFVDRHPALLDKRLLTRYYRSQTLATAGAKSGWVEPDLMPLPSADEAVEAVDEDRAPAAIPTARRPGTGHTG